MKTTRPRKRSRKLPTPTGVGSSAWFGMLARFYRIGGWRTYIVRGWYLDANGSPKTYGNGYEESFTDETQYLTNAQGHRLDDENT